MVSPPESYRWATFPTMPRAVICDDTRGWGRTEDMEYSWQSRKYTSTHGAPPLRTMTWSTDRKRSKYREFSWSPKRASKPPSPAKRNAGKARRSESSSARSKEKKKADRNLVRSSKRAKKDAKKTQIRQARDPSEVSETVESDSDAVAGPERNAGKADRTHDQPRSYTCDKDASIYRPMTWTTDFKRSKYRLFSWSSHHLTATKPSSTFAMCGSRSISEELPPTTRRKERKKRDKSKDRSSKKHKRTTRDKCARKPARDASDTYETESSTSDINVERDSPKGDATHSARPSWNSRGLLEDKGFRPLTWSTDLKRSKFGAFSWSSKRLVAPKFSSTTVRRDSRTTINIEGDTANLDATQAMKHSLDSRTNVEEKGTQSFRPLTWSTDLNRSKFGVFSWNSQHLTVPKPSSATMKRDSKTKVNNEQDAAKWDTIQDADGSWSSRGHFEDKRASPFRPLTWSTDRDPSEFGAFSWSSQYTIAPKPSQVIAGRDNTVTSNERATVAPQDLERPWSPRGHLKDERMTPFRPLTWSTDANRSSYGVFSWSSQSLTDSKLLGATMRYDSKMTRGELPRMSQVYPPSPRGDFPKTAMEVSDRPCVSFAFKDQFVSDISEQHVRETLFSRRALPKVSTKMPLSEPNNEVAHPGSRLASNATQDIADQAFPGAVLKDTRTDAGSEIPPTGVVFLKLSQRGVGLKVSTKLRSVQKSPTASRNIFEISKNSTEKDSKKKSSQQSVLSAVFKTSLEEEVLRVPVEKPVGSNRAISDNIAAQPSKQPSQDRDIKREQYVSDLAKGTQTDEPSFSFAFKEQVMLHEYGATTRETMFLKPTDLGPVLKSMTRLLTGSQLRPAANDSRQKIEDQTSNRADVTQQQSCNISLKDHIVETKPDQSDRQANFMRNGTSEKASEGFYSRSSLSQRVFKDSNQTEELSFSKGKSIPEAPVEITKQGSETPEKYAFSKVKQDEKGVSGRQAISLPVSKAPSAELLSHRYFHPSTTGAVSPGTLSQGTLLPGLVSPGSVTPLGKVLGEALSVVTTEKQAGHTVHEKPQKTMSGTGTPKLKATSPTTVSPKSSGSPQFNLTQELSAALRSDLPTHESILDLRHVMAEKPVPPKLGIVKDELTMVKPGASRGMVTPPVVPDVDAHGLVPTQEIGANKSTLFEDYAASEKNKIELNVPQPDVAGSLKTSAEVSAPDASEVASPLGTEGHDQVTTKTHEGGGVDSAARNSAVVVTPEGKKKDAASDDIEAELPDMDVESVIDIYPESHLVAAVAVMTIIWTVALLLQSYTSHSERSTTEATSSQMVESAVTDTVIGTVSEESNIYNCSTDYCLREGVYLGSLVNTGMSPCDNFYKYVCQSWESLTRPVHVSIGGAASLDTVLEERLELQVLNYVINKSNRDVLAARKLYRECTRSSKEMSIPALQEMFKHWVDFRWPLAYDVNNLREEHVWLVTARLIREFGVSALTRVTIAQHRSRKDAAVHLGPPHMLFFNGDPDMHLMLMAAVRETVIAFGSEESVDAAAQGVMSVFTGLSHRHPKYFGSDVKVVQFEDLNKNFQHFLSAVFDGMSIANATILLQGTRFLTDGLGSLVGDVGIPALLNYLGFRLIVVLAPFLPDGLPNLRRLFSIEATGRVRDPKNISLLCLQSVERVLPQCIVKVQAKLRTASGSDTANRIWLSQLESIFFRYVRRLSWIDDVTQVLAHYWLQRQHLVRFFPKWTLTTNSCTELPRTHVGEKERHAPWRLYHNISKVFQHHRLRLLERVTEQSSPGFAFATRSRQE